MLPPPDPNRPPPTRAFRAIVRLLRPIVMAMTKREWQGGENLPEGGFVAVANHIGDADPFCVVHFLVDHGVYPAILAKRELFNVPLLGWILCKVGIIPVDRGTVGASLSLDAAATAIEAGSCVLIYPEGTHTFDPELWPMTAKTGAGRLALRTGAPVVPIAVWGPQEFRYPHTRKFRFRRFPAQVAVGLPIDLSPYGSAENYDDVQRATDRIVAELTQLLAKVRGETPPQQPYDRTLGNGHSNYTGARPGRRGRRRRAP